MAVVLARDFGFQNILLGGQVGPEVQQLLPDSIDTVGLPTGNIPLG